MPWSDDSDGIKRAALAMLSAAPNVAGVLDVGAGAGLWRSNAKGLPIHAHRWVAVEAYPPYVGRFNLRKRYDFVRIRDLRTIRYGAYPGWVVLMGDVLEHLDRGAALAVLGRAASVATVVVVMPFLPTTSEEQGAVDGNEYEAHRHVWEWEDWLAATDGVGGRREVLREPPGDERNKGAVIYWHATHDIAEAA